MDTVYDAKWLLFQVVIHSGIAALCMSAKNRNNMLFILGALIELIEILSHIFSQ